MSRAAYVRFIIFSFFSLLYSIPSPSLPSSLSASSFSIYTKYNLVSPEKSQFKPNESPLCSYLWHSALRNTTFECKIIGILTWIKNRYAQGLSTFSLSLGEVALQPSTAGTFIVTISRHFASSSELSEPPSMTGKSPINIYKLVAC